jgi:LPS-assembly protein
MKNKFLILIYIVFCSSSIYAENILIESKNIVLDKNTEISIFENNVNIITDDNNNIKSDFAEYDKKNRLIKLKRNIIATDAQGNVIETEYAEYDEEEKIFLSLGPTKITTTEKYVIEGNDITFNNYKNFIDSKKEAIITDADNNKIFLNNFSYHTKKNIFKSIGYIKIEDQLSNSHEFSQIYIDTKKKEILGTDIKSFLNNDSLKINPENKPRIFANTVKISKEKNTFNKSVFTMCNFRNNDKCPPWTIQAKQMLHDQTKKTIYYNNAVIKIYDIPVFYIPKLSHPDPTVDRRSGFLVPYLSSSKNLGAGLTIPYFWDVNKDKNLTITSKLFATENPLFIGDYHQAFKNSNLKADFGFTEGYKKNSSKKKKGDKSHFFSKFTKEFKNSNVSESALNLTLQHVSNDKYLKLYKIDSEIVNYNTSTLENSIDFTHENEDVFLGLTASIFEDLGEGYNDKYEYILPDITIDKNLISNKKFGSLDLRSNYKVRNYDTNKYTNFLVNDFNWNFKEKYFKSGLKSKFLGNFRNINYETKNVDLYKKDTTNELYGALGYLSELKLFKKNAGSNHFFKPKMLVRYSPGSMRKEIEGNRLDPISAFSIDRLNNINSFETGLSATVGFDYEVKTDNKYFDFSVAQIINEKENKKMAQETSLDEKLSDLVGSASYDLNKTINLSYNFNIDQNYSALNYNEIGTGLNFEPLKIDFSYLQENKHLGDQEYFKTKINYSKNENGLISFETKRNLVTNSAEFYNLSYEYFNDCLRAGLVYRREFYNDSELEHENSLMFKITLTPFGSINSPAIGQ